MRLYSILLNNIDFSCGAILLFQTLTVLNPFRSPEVAALQDTDLAGPLVFCLAFGGFLLLVSAKFLKTDNCN